MGSRARRRRFEQSPGAEPAGSYVPSLRIVGTTWRERGFAYRWRRVRYAIFLLLILAVLAGLIALALIRIWAATPGAFWVVLALAVAAVLVTGFLEWRRAVRRRQSDYPPSSYRGAVAAVVVVGLSWLFLPYGGWLVLTAVSVLLLGPIGAQFVRACFDRELWPEREWRMSGLSPAEQRRAEREKGWEPARFRPQDHPKPDSQVHPHE